MALTKIEQDIDAVTGVIAETLRAVLSRSLRPPELTAARVFGTMFLQFYPAHEARWRSDGITGGRITTYWYGGLRGICFNIIQPDNANAYWGQAVLAVSAQSQVYLSAVAPVVSHHPVVLARFLTLPRGQFQFIEGRPDLGLAPGAVAGLVLARTRLAQLLSRVTGVPLMALRR